MAGIEIKGPLCHLPEIVETVDQTTLPVLMATVLNSNMRIRIISYDVWLTEYSGKDAEDRSSHHASAQAAGEISDEGGLEMTASCNRSRNGMRSAGTIKNISESCLTSSGVSNVKLRAIAIPIFADT